MSHSYICIILIGSEQTNKRLTFDLSQMLFQLKHRNHRNYFYMPINTFVFQRKKMEENENVPLFLHYTTSFTRNLVNIFAAIEHADEKREKCTHSMYLYFLFCKYNFWIAQKNKWKKWTKEINNNSKTLIHTSKSNNKKKKKNITLFILTMSIIKIEQK